MTVGGHYWATLYTVQVMVNVQMLAELEEVIQFKVVPERREVIREMWWNRIRVGDHSSSLSLSSSSSSS